MNEEYPNQMENPDGIALEGNESAGTTVGNQPENNTPPSPVGGWFSVILDYIQLFIPCLAVVLLIFTVLFRVCTVDGSSMNPTLYDGEKLLISNLFYEPEQGDIVVFHQTSELYPHFNEPIIKRVIATEGESIVIDFTDGIVTVDGVTLDENYIQLRGGTYRIFAEHDMAYETADDGTLHRVMRATVPAGCVFVMGDNRNDSSDSRTDVIGFVDTRRILGRVLFRITPFSKAGNVD